MNYKLLQTCKQVAASLSIKANIRIRLHCLFPVVGQIWDKLLASCNKVDNFIGLVTSCPNKSDITCTYRNKLLIGLTIGRLSLTSTSNTDTIRVVSHDVKAGFIGLATSKFGHSAYRIINVNSFQNIHRSWIDLSSSRASRQEHHAILDLILTLNLDHYPRFSIPSN